MRSILAVAGAIAVVIVARVIGIISVMTVPVAMSIPVGALREGGEREVERRGQDREGEFSFHTTDPWWRVLTSQAEVEASADDEAGAVPGRSSNVCVRGGDKKRNRGERNQRCAEHQILARPIRDEGHWFEDANADAAEAVKPVLAGVERFLALESAVADAGGKREA